MKKTYEGLEMEVIRFSTEDIITTSDPIIPTVVAEPDGSNNSNTDSDASGYRPYGTGYVDGLPDGVSGQMELYSGPEGHASLGDACYVNYNGEWIKVYPDNVLEDNDVWHVAS